MIQIPGLAPNPDDDEDQFAPIQAPQVELPPMSLGGRAPLQGVEDGRAAGGGGSAPPPPAQPGIAIMQPPERSDKTEHRGEQVNQEFTQISPEAANDLGELGIAHGDARRARIEQAGTRESVAEANIKGAEKQARILLDAETRKKEALAKAEPQIRAAMAADHQATKEMETNRKFTDYWEDKGTPAKLFAALLVGLNQYAVTGRGMGGHNMAWDIFQNAAAADRQRKLDKFNASKEMSELRKKDVVAANQALKDKVAQFDNEAVAMGKAYAAQTKAYAERLGKPAALAAAAETDAKASALEAETRLKQRKDYEKKFTVEGERRDSSETINHNASQGQGKGDPQSPNRQKAEGDAQTHDTLMRFADLNKDPRVVAEVQRAINEQMKTETGNAGIFKPIVQAGKVTGWIPLDLSGRLKSPKAQEYYQLMAVAGTAMARKMDPVGAINADSLKAGFEHFNFANASPKLLEKTARDFAKERAQMAEAAVPGYMDARGKPSAPAAAPKTNTDTAPAAKPDMRGAQRDLIESKRMLQSLPKDSPDRARWQRIHDHLIDMYGKRS